jgi:hypothetical protein
MNNQLLAMTDLNLVEEAAMKEGDMFLMQAPAPENQATYPATVVPTTTAIPTITATLPTQTPETTVPAPTVPTEQTPPVTIAAAPEPGRDTAAHEGTGTLSDIDALRQLLWERYQQNLAILQEQLEKAPEALKPALLQAIKVLEDGYRSAIASLE